LQFGIIPETMGPPTYSGKKDRLMSSCSPFVRSSLRGVFLLLATCFALGCAAKSPEGDRIAKSPADGGTNSVDSKASDSASASADSAKTPAATATTPADKTAPSTASASADPYLPPRNPPQLLTRAEIGAGWISLFDGQTLFGWKANNGSNWSIRDGIITADKSDNGTPGLLNTTFTLSDYEFRCEYRLEKGGNSGVFFRTLFDPKNPAVDCYELNMCDSHPMYGTGALVGRKIPDMKAEGEGIWRKVEVRLEGRTLSAKFDGKPVIELVDTTSSFRRSGHIGLQMNAGKIEFRNLALRPLGLQPILNESKQAGWKFVTGAKTKATYDASGVRLTNGPGFLQSEATYGDFVLQFDAQTHKQNVNSGVFFRALPGTEKEPSNGYEFQIHNGFADGDRRKPNDYQTGYGTGAIFRLARARLVVPDDEKWFTATLIADGDRFHSWVDGYPVVDFQDQRKPYDNPRRGLRQAAGHLILQLHDPDSDISFRRMQAGTIERDAPPAQGK